MSFNLATRYAADRIRFDVKDPVTEQPTGMFIELASRYSKQARAAQHMIANAQIARKEGDQITAERIDAQLLDLMVACTLVWGGFDIDGETPLCVAENVRAIYSDPRTAWIREQAQEKYMDVSSFFSDAKASSSPSPSTSSDSPA